MPDILTFHSLGQAFSIELTPLVDAMSGPARPKKAAAKRAGGVRSAVEMATSTLDRFKTSPFMKQRIFTDDPLSVVVAVPAGRGPRRVRGPARGMMIATHTLIVEGARTADIAAAKHAGAHVIHEGLDGKVLLGCPNVQKVFSTCDLLLKREVGAAVPNFLRRIERLDAAQPKKAWAHTKIKVASAWKVTKGVPDVSVAIIDEGVDTRHPALKPAVVAQKDFIGDKGDDARPDNDDAHGTACAGIAVSRDKKVPGIAPKCSLIAARIAMGMPNGDWYSDDYATADAIDWCWRQGAAVLNNSWGGGAPTDAISRAFGRARTQGRGGKGAVVVIAAGNDQGPLDFPGNLPGYLTIGASNPKDERKTKTSSDGEDWWGSNYGDEVWMVAPGVFIHTTDIHGSHGYDSGDFTSTFNGTSSAAPHVAAAVALMISANPNLTASDVRQILKDSAHPIMGQTDWTKELGYGRLDVGKAVKAAKVF